MTTIPLGVLFSQTGPYGTIGCDMHNGAILAIEEVNSSDAFAVKLSPIEIDPAGNLAAYHEASETLLKRDGVVHVVGCYTSSSRKEVLPVFEKYDGLLWYPSHYEGFEHCGNVIYTGAAPNQHIIPLCEYMLPHFGKRAFCVGSNYIWAWENNRILREIVLACSGTVEAERYLAVGEDDVEHVVEEIFRVRPSFVFSSLIGTSSIAFMEAFTAARSSYADREFAAIPVCSSTLSEAELGELSPQAKAGHIASSVYFQSKESATNARFVEAYKKRFGSDSVTSADAEASYNAVKLLALALSASGSQDIEEVKRHLYNVRFEAPQGPIKVDARNNHCYLTPSLGISNEAGQFDIVWSAESPVKPDPYLVEFNLESFNEQIFGKRLQVVTGGSNGLRAV